MTKNVSNLPAQGVVLDLDAEERDESEIKPPFVVVVKGRQITMADPAELDWRDLLTLETPADILRMALEREDRTFLQEQDIPAWKFNKLMEGYYKHYDLEEKVREAQRRSQFDR